MELRDAAASAADLLRSLPVTDPNAMDADDISYLPDAAQICDD